MSDAEASVTKSRHVRLFVSLGLSLALHAAVLSVAPGLPPWLQGGGKAMTQRPLAVTFAAPRQVAELPPAERPPAPQVQRVEPAPSSPEVEPRAKPPEQTATPATASATTNNAPTGMFPGPWYYPARYLHRRPTPLKPIWPDYPEALAKVAGRVTILLLIDETGKVDQHRILASDPPELFDRSVIAAFTAAQYAPALITGYKVKSQLLAEVTFEPGAPPRADFSIMNPALPIQDSSKSLGKEN